MADPRYRSQQRSTALVRTRPSNGSMLQVGRYLGSAARQAAWLAAAPRRAVATALHELLERRSRPHRSRRGNARRAGRAALLSRRVGRARAPVAPADFTAARLAADEGLHALAQALSDPDPSVRTAALEVVCEFSADRAAPLLAGMIHDPDPTVRCAAAGAAARLGVVRAVSSLIVALDDPVAAVRTAAAKAIEVITGRVVCAVDPGNLLARREQVQQLRQWWKERRLAELKASFPAKG